MTLKFVERWLVVPKDFKSIQSYFLVWGGGLVCFCVLWAVPYGRISMDLFHYVHRVVSLSACSTPSQVYFGRAVVFIVWSVLVFRQYYIVEEISFVRF